MKIHLLTFMCLLASLGIQAQDDGRTLLRGKVLYRNSNVPNESVINTTAEKATITNEDGEFTIPVKLGDELVFTSVNYQIEVLEVSEEILKRNRLVVEVNEKVTELDEVVVSPENQERFLELKNEQFKEYQYETDPTTEVVNIALDPTVRGMQDGLNFVNLFKALASLGEEEQAPRPQLRMSDVLRQVYDDRFFVQDLQIPQEQIENFLDYVDTTTPDYRLLLKDNEFELIDYLVDQSRKFRTELDARE